MPALKTEAITLRLTPETKAVLRQSAEQESRSLSNMLEVMIRDWNTRHMDARLAHPQDSVPN